LKLPNLLQAKHYVRLLLSEDTDQDYKPSNAVITPHGIIATAHAVNPNSKRNIIGDPLDYNTQSPKARIQQIAYSPELDLSAFNSLNTPCAGIPLDTTDSFSHKDRFFLIGQQVNKEGPELKDALFLEGSRGKHSTRIAGGQIIHHPDLVALSVPDFRKHPDLNLKGYSGSAIIKEQSGEVSLAGIFVQHIKKSASSNALDNSILAVPASVIAKFLGFK
jgi:hypothetical protein